MYNQNNYLISVAGASQSVRFADSLCWTLNHTFRECIVEQNQNRNLLRKLMFVQPVDGRQKIPVTLNST